MRLRQLPVNNRFAWLHGLGPEVRDAGQSRHGEGAIEALDRFRARSADPCEIRAVRN